MDGSPQKSNLEALEALMLEFFHPNTSNSRKREIEDNLKHFEDQRDAWKHILFFLQHTSSDCVFMYCLGALEKIILTMWVSGLQRSEKVEIRTYLMSQLKPTSTDWNVQESRSKDVKTHEQRVEEHRRDQMPPFLKTKMIKLLVIIARVDWPHFYPEFYSNILQMLQNKSTQSLALEFLQITSEELGTPRDDLIFARRQELWKLLVSQLPQTISQVTEILNSILERHVLLVSETPPSSPSGSVTSAHPRHKRPSLMFPLWASPVLSAEDEQLVQRCLSLFTHLFAWIPLDIPPLLNNQCLFRSLFLCASMGIDQNHYSVSSGEVPFLGILALGCLTELTARCRLYEGWREVSPKLAAFLHLLLVDSGKDGKDISILDPDYRDKMIHLISVFISQHLFPLMEAVSSLRPSSPLGEEGSLSSLPFDLLAAFLKFTFRQESIPRYLQCLEVWHGILDQLRTQMRMEKISDGIFETKLQSLFKGLALEVSRKMEFRTNGVQLERLISGTAEELELCDDIWLEESVENTEFSDNGERVPASAWQKFIVPSIELLVLTIQLVPDLFQPLALNPFKEILQIYLQIYLREDSSSSGSSSGGRRRLLVQNPQEATMLHSLLRDLNSHLQFLGRLVQVVATGDSVRHPQPLSPVAQSSPAGDTGAKQTSDRHSDKGCVRLTEELNGLLPTLIDVFSYGSERRLFELSPPDGSPNLPKDFLEVHAQSAATLQSWSLVLSQMQSDVLLLSSVESSPPHRNEHQHILAKEFDFLLNKLLSAAAAMIHPEFPEEIVKACLHLLCSVCSVVRPVNLFQREAMLSVYKEVDGAERFPENCRVLLYRLVTMSLVLSRSGSVVSSLNPQWDARKDHLAQFFNSVTGHFLSFPLDDPGLREAAQPAVIFAVRFLCQQMQLVDNESMKTKERCYAALKDHVERALQMLPFYIETAAVSDELLTFFLVLFRSFRRQMGATLTGEILEKFLALFSRSGISGNFLHEGTHGTRVLESFLRILELVASDSSPSFKRFIPSVLKLCLQEIYPLVATRTSHEVKGPLYGVLYSLLLNNQRYFFPSQIHLLSERDLPSSNVDNSEEFLAIMEVFGQSFLQPDIDTFRNNLVALERMNERWLLYQKQIFLEHLLPRFLTVFLQALMNQSHQILQDDIAAAIFHMASINLIVFRDQFLPQFLRESVPKLQPSQRENLLAQFKAETDLPSFAQSIQRFISDVRCYVIVNNHLPSGSSVVLHSGR